MTQPSSPPRCQVPVYAFGGAEKRPLGTCGEPMVRASEGPCVTCGVSNYDGAFHHGDGYCEKCMAPQHPYQPPLGCPVHPTPATDGGTP